jgi:tetratricopeptide (TPR) repeat protein
VTRVAIISPHDGFAGLLNDAGTSVELVAPAARVGRVLQSGVYSHRFPNSCLCEVESSEGAISRLEELNNASFALDFAIMLFDADISEGLRFKIAKELDDLLTSPAIGEHVSDILFAAPLPNEAHVETAVQVCENNSRAHAFILNLYNSQDRVRMAHSAWLSVRADDMVKKAGIDRTRGTLIRFGVFRRLVTEGRTKADESLLKSIAFTPGLDVQCSPRIVVNLVNEYVQQLPAGIKTRPQFAVTTLTQHFDMPQADERRHGWTKAPKPPQTWDTEKEKAESQVSKIADAYARGADADADRMLNELIESQTTMQRDHSHVVKSLCNIARKCVSRGRKDIGMKCLTLAPHYKNGVDAVLYLQMGDLLRDVEQYDNALVCYEIARSLDRGEKRDSIQLAIIRTASARGHYEKALEIYHRYPFLHGRVQSLSLAGTLYRKMGQLGYANNCYRKALAESTDKTWNHVPLAGLAEANRQSGEHHKAIQKYLEIFDTFADLPDGSRSVYTCSLSYLYRITRQPEKALWLLQQVLANAPMDPEVNFQLAKLYFSMGENAKANHHLKHADTPSLDRLASELFYEATGQSGHAITTRKRPEGADEFVLPENRGINGCANALIAIERRDFANAVKQFDNILFVDRLESDFGEVLKFHAVKSLDSKYNHKVDQRICRIAKCGFPELRDSVRAIVDGRFSDAVAKEKQAFLLIA